MCEVVAKAKEGDDDAVRVIWDRFFPQVVRLACQRLTDQPKQVVDEEDVAISVMESFFRAARAGRFPELEDSDGIWRLLSAMTCRKVVDQIRRNATRPVVGEAAIQDSALVSRDPTPEMFAIVRDEMAQLLTVLPEKYHQIAIKKLECLTVPEIARHCGVHVSTVERRLRIIREFWAKEFDTTD